VRRHHRSITFAITLAVVLMSVATAVAYLRSTVNAYLLSTVNGPASVVTGHVYAFYISGPPGIHAPPEPSAAELRAALAFTRCMRAYGFSQFPDPLTTVADVASLTVGPGEYFPLNSPGEVQSPAFRQTGKACGVHLPSLPPPSANGKRSP
jgi:hypothetical protein